MNFNMFNSYNCGIFSDNEKIECLARINKKGNHKLISQHKKEITV